MKVDWSDDFKTLYKERGQQRYGIRLLALWKIQEGMTETEVCKLIGKSHTSIRKWRKTYEKEGIEALLKIQKGRGRKARIQGGCLEQALTELNKEKKGGRILCQDIVDYIADKHLISYSRTGMYCMLHRLGFSWITARSQHPHHNPEAREDFKKSL